MKLFKTITKIVAAVAVVCGAVYVIATYGDKIVAWAKDMMRLCKEKLPCCCCGCDCSKDDSVCDCSEPAEQEPAAEVNESDFEG